MATIEHNVDPVGKKVVLNQDITTPVRTFLKGSVMTIIYSGPRGWDVQDDETGYCILECGFNGHSEFDKLGW